MVNIGKYTEEANKFFKRIATELGTPDDIGHASRVAVSVLHTLRERITVEESMHLISQLPMILKGIYVDGWNISREMSQSETLDEFLDDIRSYNLRTAGRDFGTDQEAKENVRAVLRVMRDYVSEGEMNHVRNQLPKPIAVLFDEQAGI